MVLLSTIGCKRITQNVGEDVSHDLESNTSNASRLDVYPGLWVDTDYQR